jgi:inhibitor of the pro-sigma K processing machinery
MDLTNIIIIGIIIIVLGIFGFRILYGIGKIVLYIGAHAFLGLILLFLFNLLPFFKIPINILTVLFAGFGGIIGFGILLIGKVIGLY